MARNGKQQMSNDDNIYTKLRMPDEPAPKVEPVAEGPSPFQKLVLRVSDRFMRLDEDVKKVVETNFKQIVKSGLGIESRWGENRLVHTNGFRSKLDNLIGQLARNYIQKDAAHVLDEILKTEKKFAVEMRKEFMEVFQEEYYRGLAEELKRLVAEKQAEVTESLTEEAREFVKNLDTTVGPVLQTEITNLQKKLLLAAERGERGVDGF